MLLKKLIGKSEENVHLDRYLITYADLITLLLGLFVILYVSAQVDEAKYKEFSKAFSKYFTSAGEQGAASGNGALPGNKEGIPEPIMSSSSAKKSIQDIRAQTEQLLGKYLEKGTIGMKVTSSGLTLSLPEKLLFSSGKAEIQQEALPILDTLSVILRGINKQVTFDGHTDSEPIRTFRYESNWHLSVARALSIGYYLIGKGLPENNSVIRGFSSERPIADNSTEDGRAQNRRVEITVSELPSNAPSTVGYNVQESKK